MGHTSSRISIAVLLLCASACGPQPRDEGDSSGNNADGGWQTLKDGGAADAGTGVGHIKACLFENGALGNCNLDGLPFNVAFGTTPVGRSKRTIKLISDGTADVVVSGLTLNGDTEFTVDPGAGDFQSTTLAPGSELTFVVDFTAIVAGTRTARLTFTTSDASNPSLVINVNAIGDDARLCACLVNGASCTSTTQVDFGDVAVGATGHAVLRLSACGNDPVTFDRVQVVNGALYFGIAGLPATNTVLQPGGATIDLQLSFTPVMFRPEEGRFTIVTTSRTLDIDLTGTGVDGQCKLTASAASIAFGPTVVGAVSTKSIEVTNEGVENCTFLTAASITAGVDVAFGVVNAPDFELASGEKATVTVSYSPADLNAPDSGLLSIPYGDAFGVSIGALGIPLTGTPAAVQNCKLVVTPGGTNPSSRTLDFGPVTVNTTKVLPVTLTNVGALDCTVSSVKKGVGSFASIGGLTGAEYSIASNLSGTVASGATATIDVSFTPSKEGSFGSPFATGGASIYSINLLVTTSDTSFDGQDCGTTVGGTATAGCIGWGFAGSGVKSELAVLPGDVDFGNVTVGCHSAEYSVTLVNSGSAPITIKSIRIDPTTPAGQTPIFTLVAPATPFTLSGGASKKIPILFRPPGSGPYTATLYVESDANNGSLLSLPLRGKGEQSASQSQTYLQGAAPKADILFVVDNSGSMGEEQSLLASNAQSFFGNLSQSNIDYQIAVVTTDIVAAKESGNFQGSTKIIRPSTVNGASVFANTVNGLGTNGDATEQGLKAAMLALSDPLISNPQKNGGFLRPDARLVVVIVSDEDDSSPGPADLYTQFLWSLKPAGRQDLVSLSAVVGDSPSGCSSTNGDALAGTRYLTVQQQTAGLFQSICSYNWGQIGQAIGQAAAGASDRIRLSEPAVESSISIDVNGTVASSSDWTWDEATNSIVFNQTSIPANGDTVTVTYDRVCN